MPTSPKSEWRFAPTNGGAEQVASAGQTAFANNPVEKAVRELLQNSLDHPQPGLDTVRVEFNQFNIAPETIDASSLCRHLEQCRKMLETEADPRAQEYATAIQTLSQSAIPVLSIVDKGTTGLRPQQWRNLIFREGASAIPGATVHGGSYGMGKNAPFNLSLAKTVLYSTRYVSREAHGRVTHLAGRSQLATHPDPDDPENLLQPIGFYAVHRNGQYNQPITPPPPPPPPPPPFPLNSC